MGCIEATLPAVHRRAYDQLQHDVAIQHLPVKLLIGGAGVGGRDGPTHAGLLDIAMLLPMPGMLLPVAPTCALRSVFPSTITTPVLPAPLL